MEFFCFHRDREGSTELRRKLVEDHWSYMDRFERQLIVRGPTFDRGVLTGSVHVVDLAGPAEARAFAFDEPSYQAGAYRDVLLRRWHNTLGRTMWEYTGDRTSGTFYLVLGFTTAPLPAAALTLPPHDLVSYGPLLSDDGAWQVGTAALVSASSPEAARDVLDPHTHVGIEVRAWEFGGRRD